MSSEFQFGELTYDEAVELARNAVADRGEDYVYTNPQGDRSKCWYSHMDEDGSRVPGCIIGHILHQIGIDLTPELDSYGSARMLLNILCSRETLRTHPAALEFLVLIQADQDMGKPWGRAIEDALM